MIPTCTHCHNNPVADPDAPNADTTGLCRQCTRRPRRDPAGIVLASILLVTGAILLLGGIGAGGWTLLLIIPGVALLAFGGVGLTMDLQRVTRDHHGIPRP